MLKKVLAIGIALVFAVGILATSAWRASARSICQSAGEAGLVQDEGMTLDEEATESVQEEATEAAERKVDYDLTWGGKIYPGLLPDHFLYPLKMIRDQIRLFLTTDPLKKAELLLVYADKRLAAAKALIEKDEVDLGITTLTKAEKYLEKAINQERIAKQAGEDTGVFLEKLLQATLKHEEVILGFGEKVSETMRPVYGEVLQYTRQGYQKVMEVIGK